MQGGQALGLETCSKGVAGGWKVTLFVGLLVAPSSLATRKEERKEGELTFKT